MHEHRPDTSTSTDATTCTDVTADASADSAARSDAGRVCKRRFGALSSSAHGSLTPRFCGDSRLAAMPLS
jgi:hypothetical protein